MNIYIFGARATAAGLYKYLKKYNPENNIISFLVSHKEENVSEMWGCPVREIDSVAKELSEKEKSEVLIYGAVPEFIHDSIKELIGSYGFENIIILDSRLEASIMEKYYEAQGEYISVHNLEEKNNNKRIPKLTMYSASFYKDIPIKSSQELPSYVKKIFLGCEGAIKNGVDIQNRADFYDNIGDNISSKNYNRCEMTAHYWIWKNRLNTDDEYVGVCHYRRILDLSDEDLIKIAANDVDVVLPFPMIHYPNANIQHTWYVKEQDWKLAKEVVYELYPEYGAVFDDVFNKSEFYNYNIFLAKKYVFEDYCSWLYPILDRIEELSIPRGCDRSDRYTAYLSESLGDLYFMANLNNLKIAHTGRLLIV